MKQYGRDKSCLWFGSVRTQFVSSVTIVTCEITLSQNYYFNLRRRPSEIVLFQRVETCLKLFYKYFRGLLQLMNIFHHVRCRRNNFEIILELL